MKLKLVYTGNPAETQVVNSETGEAVDGIHSIEVSVDAFSGYAVLVLQDFITEIDNMEAEVMHAEGNDRFIGTPDN